PRESAGVPYELVTAVIPDPPPAPVGGEAGAQRRERGIGIDDRDDGLRRPQLPRLARAPQAIPARAPGIELHEEPFGQVGDAGEERTRRGDVVDSVEWHDPGPAVDDAVRGSE